MKVKVIAIQEEELKNITSLADAMRMIQGLGHAVVTYTGNLDTRLFQIHRGEKVAVDDVIKITEDMRLMAYDLQSVARAIENAAVGHVYLEGYGVEWQSEIATIIDEANAKRYAYMAPVQED